MDELKASQLRRAAQIHYRAGRRVAALEQLDQLIGLNAAQVDDWLLTGRLLCELGEFAQALAAFENCLKLAPRNIEARYELGRAVYKLGDADRAAELIEQVAQETGHWEVWMGLATIAPAVPRYDQARVKEIREKFAELTRQAELPSRGTSPAKTHKPAPGRQESGQGSVQPVRLGYLSAHWHDANYMKPVWPLINAHDRTRFQIYLFDDGPPRTDAWQWLHDDLPTATIHGLDNRLAAHRISTAKLDILVDLSAYSQPERMGLFVHRPAPIQMAWFNMYATSGFQEIDYLIGDRQVMQAGEQRFYTERCLQLPISYLTFQTNHAAPEVRQRQAAQNSPFTFGCLGTLYKLAPEVIATWSEILRQADEARLVLAGRELKSLCNQQFVLDQFERCGVSAQRIAILPPAVHYEFLQYYDLIDVALDTFPYNGGTTTMEAMWQGVPVLTFNGDRWVSRTSRSLLDNCHLSAFAVADRQEYICEAVRLATVAECRTELQSIRGAMREALSVAAVCDSQMLARQMEELYLTVQAR